ncbi:DNA methylase [Desulfobacter hydrogenophilus]|uniref:DNA methylase n=1 Tax=Desulfobacter hydrogenophilus TaxID=2291 RepID=A0A328F7V0_9BACT|nr:DNA methylase [Desulfobacter hydrogenophilus]RAM00691.1 DNA methylase [Desulfobacter hydrogenophilus]
MEECLAGVQNQPISDIIKVPRTDPIYNCHGYLTKVPVGAIIPFINHYSKPTEKVADIFAGSGMTGIAAVMSGRDVELSDISVLGQHIAQGYLAKVTPQELTKAAKSVVSKTRKKFGHYYQTIREEDGTDIELVRTIWSFVYACPKCGYELIFYDHVMLPEAERKDVCPECDTKFSRRTWNGGSDIPVKVVVKGVQGKQIEQDIQEIDFQNINDAKAEDILSKVPSLSIDPEREMYSRSGLKNRGLTETKKFFSARNAIILTELWDNISKIEEERIRKKLQFAFTAILPRASRRYQWSKQRPLNAQNQTYYISPVYFEWNVFELFLRKVNAAKKSDDVIYNSSDVFGDIEHGNARYSLASADLLEHLDSDSIDYIFTDPPFGSNIFYSDMSLFHEAWIGQTTDNANEAVIHTCGKKKVNAAVRYGELLKGAFKEAYRVLKPGKYMSVVFGNSKGNVWSLVLTALREAGFDSVPDHIAILDKGQRSVKGLSSGSESVVTVDLIMTVHKPTDKAAGESNVKWRQAEPEELIEAAIFDAENGDAKNPSYVYAHILREAIKRHLLVDNLHLSDVLIALRKAGYSVDPKTGKLSSPN